MGCLSSYNNKELELILPADEDYNLYILSKRYAETLFNGNIQDGLHVIDLEYNSLFPVVNYQKSKWDLYEKAITSVFSNLGAKKIVIREEKNIKINASAGVPKGSGGMEMNAKQMVNLEWSSEEPIYNSLVAQRNLHLLKEISLFHDIAQNLIEQKRSMSLKKTETVSFNFGVNVDVLECFHGESNIGMDKELYMEFIF